MQRWTCKLSSLVPTLVRNRAADPRRMPPVSLSRRTSRLRDNFSSRHVVSVRCLLELKDLNGVVTFNGACHKHTHQRELRGTNVGTDLIPEHHRAVGRSRIVSQQLRPVLAVASDGPHENTSGGETTVLDHAWS